MPELKISGLFEISNRFLRSAHLERDFHDPNALNEYILSDFARNCLKRLAKGLENNSGQRAWRITGDYGSGKSSFALFLAHWFAGEAGNFPKPIKNLVDYKHYIDEGPRYIPILVTGSRLPLRDSLLKALYDCLSLIHTRGKKPKILLELEKAIQSKDQISDEQLINYIINSNRYIILSNKGTGALIIIDELGKSLLRSILSSRMYISYKSWLRLPLEADIAHFLSLGYCIKVLMYMLINFHKRDNENGKKSQHDLMNLFLISQLSRHQH